MREDLFKGNARQSARPPELLSQSSLAATLDRVDLKLYRPATTAD
jgi:hypothetical protein